MISKPKFPYLFTADWREGDVKVLHVVKMNFVNIPMQKKKKKKDSLC